MQSGIYVEMKVESLNVVTTPSSPQRHKASAQRSIIIGVKALLLLGLHCPDKESRDRPTYARLIIREAQRHGGQGWLAYDRFFFRQQAALDPSLQWNVLHLAGSSFQS